METMPPPPPPQPRRSYTTLTDVDSKKKKPTKDASPPPPLYHRSATQPIEIVAPAAAPSKKSSKTRHGEDSGYSSPAATPGLSTKYQYADTAAPPRPDLGNYRTVLREPGSSSRRKSTSPVREDTSRPSSKTAAKMVGLDPKSYAAPPKVKQYAYPTGDRPAAVVVEPSPRSSRRDRVKESDRDFRSHEKPRTGFFGENGVGTVDPRPNQTRYRDEDINYGPGYGEVQYSTSSRRDRPQNAFVKPSLGRSSTSVY